MNEDETILLGKAQNGDVDAFAELFESLRSRVFAVALRVVGPDDADDVVMETYLKAWQAIPKFNRRSSLTTWLYRIARNCSIDFIRSRKRRKERVLTEQEGEETAWADVADEKTTGPDMAMAKAEQVAEIRAALDQLPEEHRLTLLLRFTDGLSYAEIAAATGVSIGTVMSRLFYGKRRLKKVVAEGESQ